MAASLQKCPAGTDIDDPETCKKAYDAVACGSGYDKYQGWSSRDSTLYSAKTVGITEAACQKKAPSCGGYYYDSKTSGGWCKTITAANVEAVRKDHATKGSSWVEVSSTSTELREGQLRGRVAWGKGWNPRRYVPSPPPPPRPRSSWVGAAATYAVTK